MRSPSSDHDVAHLKTRLGRRTRATDVFDHNALWRRQLLSLDVGIIEIADRHANLTPTALKASYR